MKELATLPHCAPVQVRETRHSSGTSVHGGCQADVKRFAFTTSNRNLDNGCFFKFKKRLGELRRSKKNQEKARRNDWSKKGVIKENNTLRSKIGYNEAR